MIEWSDELSPFDYMMFRADADPHSRTTIMTVELLDEVPDRTAFRLAMDRASRIVPRLRQHVVAPLVPLASARWVIDPDFDLDYHLRWISLPGPAGLREVLDLAQIDQATPLDPHRPLWEVTVIEGVEDGDARCALVWKLSHAVTDGVGGMILDRVIRSEERHPEPEALPPVPTPEDVTALDLTRSAARGLPAALLRQGLRVASEAAGIAGQVVSDPSGTMEQALAVASNIAKLNLTPPADPSPLLAGRSLHRRIIAYDLPLSALRNAAKAHDCSVNDAYLAAIGAALGHYHDMMGVPVEAVPLAMPVNVRASGESGISNNWTSAMLALPTDQPDPIRRMQQVREQVLTARTGSSLDPGRLVAPLAAWLPNAALAGAGPGMLGIDVQASNVPGHPDERYIAGAKILSNVPIGPAPGVAMMVTMVSQARHCYIGVNLDTAAVTDADAFAESLAWGFDDVVALGRAGTTTSTSSTDGAA